MTKMTVTCPNWCEVKDHEHDRHNHPDDGLNHIARVGPFVLTKNTPLNHPDWWFARRVAANEDDSERDFSVYGESPTVIARELRQIAADSLAAAEWLEAHA